jgi:TonB family protein
MMPKSLSSKAFILSVVVHIVAVLYQIEKVYHQEAPQKKVTKTFHVMFDRPAQAKSKKLQIVESEAAKEKIKPKDAKFLGKSDQSFDRQTIARNIGAFKEAGGQEQKNSQKSQDKNKEMQKVKSVLGKISLGDLSQNNTTLGKFHPVKTNKLAKGGPSSTSDYVEDIPLGDMTHLNTVEFKFYGFYHRIRQKLEQYWGNSLREKADILAKQGRKIASDADKITSLAIYIDDKGNIVKIVLKGTSGVKELDDAAVESFNKAGPFPNPPNGMMQDGVAVIEWGFVVKG